MVKRTKRRMKGATGIFVGEDRLVVTTLMRRSVGAKKLDTFEILFGDEGPSPALRELADEGRLANEVVCGLDPRRIFSVTRELGVEEQGREPTDLVNQLLASFDGGVVAAMQPVKLPAGVHHHLVAAPRNIAFELHDTLAERKSGGARFVPAPVALMHLARRSLRQPRRWHASLRVIQGDDQGVVMLCHKDVALAWRLYDPNDRESLTIAVFGLRSHAQDELGLRGLDGLILHLGDDEAATTLAEDFASRFELTCLTASKVSLDPATISHALALSGLRPQWEDLDLFSDLRPRGGFRHNFPSRVVPALVLLIIGISIYLWMEVDELELQTARLSASTDASIQSIGAPTKGLKVLHEKRSREMDVIEAFVVKRVFWVNYLRELPKLVPPSMSLRRVDARDAVILKKKSAAVVAKLKRFSLTGDVELGLHERQPKEVALLANALQNSELFQIDFPIVEGSNTRLQAGAGGSNATIAVTCKPRIGGKGG